MSRAFAIVGIVIGLLIAPVLQGCATNRETAAVAGEVDLTGLKRVHVVKSASDERGIDIVIAMELEQLGIRASTGAEADRPKDIDAIVTYQDRWMWDLTMYMIELRVQIRDPATGALLAMGQSMHTSLTRLAPRAMAAEVLRNMLRRSKAGASPAG